MKKILLVEDDLATIDIYEISLKKAGFEVETIKWGAEATEKIKKISQNREIKPDLILLDLILPDINGIEVLREIRKHRETEKIPVFIMTNFSDQKMEKASMELAAEKYLMKTGCTPRELIAIIKNRLKD